MGTLQLSLTTSNKWSGLEGPEYWRRKPTIEEAIFANIRVKGGVVIAVDQISIIASYVEPQSGAFKWLESMREGLTEDIKNATKGIYPQHTLTPEFKQLALGHHSQDGDYVSRLEDTLKTALPPDAIAKAVLHMPSKTSGALVLLPQAQPKQLTPQQQWLLKEYRAHQNQLRDEYQALQSRAKQLKTAQARYTTYTNRRAEADAIADPQAKQQAIAALGAAPSALNPAQAAELNGSGSQGFKLLQEINECEAKVAELENATATIVDPRAVEAIPAFEHPTTGRLVTPHDAVILKLFAALDIMYGTADPITQAKFNELEQGKGANVPADESVREFAARIQLHANACTNLQPGAAVTRFFAGLADRDIANEAKRTLQYDKNQAQSLANAADLVQLALYRKLEDLRNRASGGDMKAAEELKKLTSTRGKSSTGTPKDEPNKTRPKVLSNKDHPKSLCTMHPNSYHTNEDCKTQKKLKEKGAAGATVRTMVAAVEPNSDTIERLVQQVNQLSFQVAAAMAGGRPGRGLPPLAGSNPSAPAGRCNFCGFIPGHPNGKCNFDNPAQAPSWIPGDRSAPHLVAHWRKRREEAGLPPLPWPRPRGAVAAPVGLALPAPGYGDQQLPLDHIALPMVATLDDGWDTANPILMAATLEREPQACVQLRSYLQKPKADQQPAVAANPPVLPSKTLHPSALPPSLNPERTTGPSHTQAIVDTPVRAELMLARDSDILERLRLRNAADSHLAVNPSTPHTAGGARKRLRFADEANSETNHVEAASLAKAPHAGSSQQGTSMPDILGDDVVVCLDTFINRNPAEGVSIRLPDGRLQQPDGVVADSGATFDVADYVCVKDMGLHHRPVNVSLILADASKIPVKGITDPVGVLFGKGTPHQREVLTRLLVVDNTSSLFNILISKRTSRKVGGYVDPAKDTFFYRPDPADVERLHGLPVRTFIPAAEVDINAAAFMQQVAVAKAEVQTPAGTLVVDSMEQLCALADSAVADAAAASGK